LWEGLTLPQVIVRRGVPPPTFLSPLEPLVIKRFYTFFIVRRLFFVL
jgi:hypothetical protein